MDALRALIRTMKCGSVWIPRTNSFPHPKNTNGTLSFFFLFLLFPFPHKQLLRRTRASLTPEKDWIADKERSAALDKNMLSSSASTSTAAQNTPLHATVVWI